MVQFSRSANGVDVIVIFGDRDGKLSQSDMSNDLSLPRPGRLQAGKRTRVRRKRRPHHGDPAPMNMNATAQMVTTTQVGCGKNRDRFIVRDHTVFDTKADAFIGLGDVCYLLNEADAKINARSYPVPPHTMTNRGHLRG